MDNSIQDEIPLTKEFLTVKIVEITGRADLKFGEVIYSAHYRLVHLSRQLIRCKLIINDSEAPAHAW